MYGVVYVCVRGGVRVLMDGVPKSSCSTCGERRWVWRGLLAAWFTQRQKKFACVEGWERGGGMVWRRRWMRRRWMVVVAAVARGNGGGGSVGGSGGGGRRRWRS